MQANLCNKGGEVIEQHGRHLQGGEVAAVLEVHRVLQVGELVPQLPVGRRGQIEPEAGTAHGHRGLHPIQLQTPVGLGHVLQIETTRRGGRVGQVVDHQVVQHCLQAEDRHYSAEVLLQAGIRACLELFQDVGGQSHGIGGQSRPDGIRLGGLNVEVAGLLQ